MKQYFRRQTWHIHSYLCELLFVRLDGLWEWTAGVAIQERVRMSVQIIGFLLPEAAYEQQIGTCVNTFQPKRGLLVSSVPHRLCRVCRSSRGSACSPAGR